jgi:hypothetical protein
MSRLHACSCGSGLLRELLRGLDRRRQQPLIGHDLSDESELGGPFRVEEPSQEDQLGGADVSEARRKQIAAPEFGDERQVDERHLNFALSPAYTKSQ